MGAENDEQDIISVRKIDLGSIKSDEIIFPGEELYQNLVNGIEENVAAEKHEQGCKTTSEGPQVNAACIFPFIYRGKEYNKCTYEKGDDTPWCSTKVDANGNHVSGQKQWGYCGEQCPILGQEECRTIGGSRKNEKCIFPFIYKGKRYTKCLWSEGEPLPWCSTKVSKHGFHVGNQGQWGYCDTICPISIKPGHNNEVDEPEKPVSTENEAENPDDIRNIGNIEEQVEDYYDEGGDEYQYYDEYYEPDLTKPLDRIAGATSADYTSGSSGVSEIKTKKRRCKTKCLQYKRVRKDGILGNLVWQCIKKGCQESRKDR